MKKIPYIFLKFHNNVIEKIKLLVYIFTKEYIDKQKIKKKNIIKLLSF